MRVPLTEIKGQTLSSACCITFYTHTTLVKQLHLHGDCSGHNKNRYIMQYLARRILIGLNKILSLIVGHTKFSPNWCFKLFKQAFLHTKVGCLDDIARVVEESAVVNHAQLVASSQDGEVIMPTYDWAVFRSPLLAESPERDKGNAPTHIHLLQQRFCLRSRRYQK